jgi:hypothetical protein
METSQSENQLIAQKNELDISGFSDDRFLGHSIFWRNLEMIHTKHLYRPDSVEYKSIKLMFMDAIILVTVLLTFSLSVIGLVSNNSSLLAVSQSDLWFSGVDSVNNAESFWSWLSGDFINITFSSNSPLVDVSEAVNAPPEWLSMSASSSESYVSLYGLFGVNSENAGWAPHLIGPYPFNENVLLGSVRLRQLSVLNSTGDCFYTERCFPRFREGLQDKSKFIRAGTPESIASAFIWQQANRTQQSTIDGRYGRYPGDGYVFNLPIDPLVASSQIEALKDWSWVDASTRAIIIELSLVNSRVPAVINNVFLFEFPGSGEVVPSEIINPLPSTVSPPISIAAFSAFVAYIFYVVFLLFRTGPSDFFTYAWNYLDLLTIVLYLYSTSILISANIFPSILSPVYAPLLSSFMPFSTYIDYCTQYRNVSAVLFMLLWFRLVKPLALIPVFRTAVKIFERSSWNMVVFLGPYLLFLTSIVIGTSITYGTKSSYFTSTSDSFLSIWFMYSYSIDLSSLFWSSPELRLLNTVVYVLYLITVWLLVFPSAVGICLMTYRQYTLEVEQAKAANLADRYAQYPPEVNRESIWHKDPVCVFLYTWVHTLTGVQLINEKDEDVGATDEQRIDIFLLPEVIQTRWREKREQLNSLLESRSLKRHVKSASTGRLSGSRFGKAASRALSYLSSKGESRSKGAFAASRSSAPDDSQITRIQLQRFLDADKEVVNILTSGDDSLKLTEDGRLRALDIIRKYSTPEAVSKKVILESLLGSQDGKLTGRAATSVRQGLDGIINELETTWKHHMTGIMETASEISKSLLKLKEAMDNSEQVKGGVPTKGLNSSFRKS